ncbi:MAG: hypothetical protein EXX96DRAFT_539117 [Benjaminiella poitrasii]|nr:MAG: hypothetical protein EXX96DRAFT_539117 [Benjaminiella poitrasii]
MTTNYFEFLSGDTAASSSPVDGVLDLALVLLGDNGAHLLGDLAAGLGSERDSDRKRSCEPCGKLHAYCDGQSPCQRCTARRRVNRCTYERKKKAGRPRGSSSKKA